MADLPAQLRREIRRTVALDILHHEAANELERLRQFSKDVRYWHSEFADERISAESLATYVGMTIGEIDAARKATP